MDLEQDEVIPVQPKYSKDKTKLYIIISAVICVILIALVFLLLFTGRKVIETGEDQKDFCNASLDWQIDGNSKSADVFLEKGNMRITAY